LKFGKIPDFYCFFKKKAYRGCFPKNICWYCGKITSQYLLTTKNLKQKDLSIQKFGTFEYFSFFAAFSTTVAKN